MVHRLVQVLVFLPLAIILIALSVANRHSVTISLDPFGGGGAAEPALSLSAPLFLVIFLALFVGVVIGGVATWISQGKWRKTARLSRREARQWQSRADEAERKEAAGRSGPQLPALRQG